MKIEKVIFTTYDGGDYWHCAVFVDGILEYAKGDDYHAQGDSACQGYIDCIKNNWNKIKIKNKEIIILDNFPYGGWIADKELQDLYDNNGKCK